MTTAAVLGAISLAGLAWLLTSGHLRMDSYVLVHGNRITSWLFLAAAGFTFLWGVRSADWDAFQPLRLFFSVWFALLGLSLLRVTTVERPFTLKTTIVILSGLGGFFLGALWARRGKPSYVCRAEDMPSAWKLDWQPRSLLLVTLGLAAISSLAFFIEYLHAGWVPLFSDDPNWARFNFAYNSYVQRFAVSAYIVPILAYLGFVHVKKNRALYFVLALLGATIMNLMTARMFLAEALWAAMLLFHYGRRRFKPMWLLMVVLIVYPLAKIATDVARFQNNPAFLAVLDNIDFPESARIFAPDYLYAAMNLQVLQYETEIVPSEESYSYGWYTAYPLRVFFTPKTGTGFRDRLDDLFWDRAPEWFGGYYAVVTTYLGVPYKDFGIPGVAIFSVIFGWLAMHTYVKMRTQPSFWHVFVYSQLAFALVHSSYSCFLSSFDFYWNLLVLALVNWALQPRHAPQSLDSSLGGAPALA